MEELLKQVQTLTSRLNAAESRIRELETDAPAQSTPAARLPPSARPPATARSSSSPQRPTETQTFGRNPLPVRKPATRFFTASMRGGPLTEPMRPTHRTFLTPREREDPENAVHGPSLLLRRSLIEQGFNGKAVATAIEEARLAKRASNPALDVGEEALRLLRSHADARRHDNLIDDDNPYNDGIKYWPFRGFAFPPSNFRGPADHRQTDEVGARLELEFVYGYRGDNFRSNLFYTRSGKIVYHTAAVGIVYDTAANKQSFFTGHDDDIVSLALHPGGVLCATGQVKSLGKSEPRILIWSTETLALLKEISGFHQRAVICLSFSADGLRLSSIGNDNSHMIAIYECDQVQKDKRVPADWSVPGSIVELVGSDKGHNAPIYEAKFNPVSNHIVACGERYLRFFGLKDNPSPTESKIWAKKGILTSSSKREAQADIICLAFGPDGEAYAGTYGGEIYEFHEQTVTRKFVAHQEAVSALWFDASPGVNRLFSSGHDGLVKAWEMPQDPRVQPRTTSSSKLRWASKVDGVMMDGVVDLHPWVTEGLEAAAHALHSSDRAVLVGTISNEIYELDMGSPDGSPMCIMQGHFTRRVPNKRPADEQLSCELKGISAHPSAPEIVTVADDKTLRVWNLERKHQTHIRMFKQEGRSCCHSPDGSLIAVGFKNGGWVVVDAVGLQDVFAQRGGDPRREAASSAWGGAHRDASTPRGGELRREEIGDLKFSPCGTKLAVASHDGFIDLYDTQSWVRFGECRGHSSYVTHIDWSTGEHQSQYLQSTCGAYELLFWDATKKGRGKQVPYASSLKDVEWATQSCIFGWPVMGVWSEGFDGTDINMVARSNKRHSAPDDKAAWRSYLVTADDVATVRLFHYPCIRRRAKYKEHRGHSSHVSNVCWSFNDAYVLSTGGAENSIFQWRLVADAPLDSRTQQLPGRSSQVTSGSDWRPGAGRVSQPGESTNRGPPQGRRGVGEYS